MSAMPIMSLDPALPLGGMRTVAGAVLVPPEVPDRPQPCGVFDGGVPVVESLCFGGSATEPDTVFPAARQPQAHLAGTWLFGGVISGHFGHMLCEATGRLWALDRLERVDGLLFFARPFDKARQVQKAFAHLAEVLGLPPARVVTEPTGVERLVVAEQGFGSGELLNGRPEARAFLRGRMARMAPEGQARRFFVTRSGQPARRGRVLDEAGLEPLFAAAGYEVIRPEDHPLAKQVAMFRAASHVVATEGSPLHLVSFAAPQGCKVAVIQRRRSAVFSQICESLRWFLGAPPMVFDAALTVHARQGGRSGNFTYLEPSRVALRAGLVEAGFVPAATPDWPELTAQARAAAVRALEEETGHSLPPVAVEALAGMEEDGVGL